MSRAPARSLLLLAFAAFISLGLPDTVLGIAWPSLRDEFGLAQALLVVPPAAGSIAYFLSGLWAGRLMHAVGVGVLLAASTALVAGGICGMAVAPTFWLFVLAGPVVGFGSGAIDAALNTYGASHFRPKHMSLLHACYAAGATLGPAIMTAVLEGGASWRVGYGIVAALLAGLAVSFVAARHRWDRPRAEAVLADAPGNVGPLPVERPVVSGWSVLRDPRVRLQLAIFFLYTGIEVAIGQWSFTVLTEARGVAPTTAGVWVTAYWTGLLVGRIALGFVVELLGPVRLLRLATVGTLAATVLFALPSRWLQLVALPLCSLALASIYPGLMSETPRRVGVEQAPHAVGFQMSAATVGLVVVPGIAAVAGQWLGLEAIPFVIAAGALLLLLLHERLVAIADRIEPG